MGKSQANKLASNEGFVKRKKARNAANERQSAVIIIAFLRPTDFTELGYGVMGRQDWPAVCNLAQNAHMCAIKQNDSCICLEDNFAP